MSFERIPLTFSFGGVGYSKSHYFYVFLQLTRRGPCGNWAVSLLENSRNRKAVPVLLMGARVKLYSCGIGGHDEYFRWFDVLCHRRQ